MSVSLTKRTRRKRLRVKVRPEGKPSHNATPRYGIEVRRGSIATMLPVTIGDRRKANRIARYLFDVLQPEAEELRALELEALEMMLDDREEED